jgi:hypothetical protein
VANPATLSAPHPLPLPRLRARIAGLRRRPADGVSFFLVLAITLALAGLTYARFLEVDRYLWTASTHDRNAHYLYALKLATDVRQGQVGRLLADLNEGRVWPPLHGVLAGTVLLCGGLDYRLAVLPSLAGWVGAALFGFLLARRAVPCGGNLAGWTAAVFLLASPAHRAYATDVMLESLGGCLSLAALYFYLVAVQSRGESKWPGRLLGLSLTLLFVHKYNYWLLVVLGLGAATAASHSDVVRCQLARLFSGIDWRDVVRDQWRQPLNYVFAVLLLLIGWIAWRGDTPVVLFGKPLSVYPPHNFIHAAYVVLFLRLLPFWRRPGRAWLGGLDGRAAQVVRWHLLPLAIWFLLPKHPSYFLWYLSLANASNSQTFNLAEGWRSYLHWVVEDYHAAAWSALLAAVLAISALLARRRLRPGGQAVLWFFVLALALTVAHPNRKGRNLHSWLAAGWVAAGMGLATAIHGRLTARHRPLRPWLASVALGGVTLVHLPALTAQGHAPEGGPRPDQLSLLELTDAYLPFLDHANRATVLAAVPVKPLVQWTYLEHFGTFDRLEENWYGFGPPGEGNRQAFQTWLRSPACDTIVYLDRTPGPNIWEDVPDTRLHAELRDLLFAQNVFQEVSRRAFPRAGCTVHVWRNPSRARSAAE